jgi:hypothetical protein
MIGTKTADEIAQRFEANRPLLNERTRRRFAAAEALALGRGGRAAVSRATGVSRRAINRGIRELLEGDSLAPDRIRRPGAGRKALILKDKTLLDDLDRLVDPTARGDPMSPLRWTCKSTTSLAEELQRMGHTVSHDKVGDLLHGLRYSLQGNRKSLEGSSHPDRDAQFRYINETAQAFMAAGQPVISVDAKKRELVGNFRNGGREWRPEGSPEEVNVYDFIDKELGRATPYGVYDLSQNAAWVSVGIDHNTAAFAVASVGRWWEQMGHPTYPEATRLLINADGGGSNGSRVRLWKAELQKLADDTGLEITVCHFPPGTSKWNKIEHRLFSYISQNWCGRPLITHEVIVSLIGATTTHTGLRVQCEIDRKAYPKGLKIADEDFAQLSLNRHEFHGEWNYTIRPRREPD